MPGVLPRGQKTLGGGWEGAEEEDDGKRRRREEKVLPYGSLFRFLFLYFPEVYWPPLPFCLHFSEVPEVPNSVLESLWHCCPILVPCTLQLSFPLRVCSSDPSSPPVPQTPSAASVLVHKSILLSGLSEPCSANSASSELAPQPSENGLRGT